MTLGIAALSLYLAIPSHTIQESDVLATELRCEYKVSPVGIDSQSPRLSWLVAFAANKRDTKQSAYRILVASSPKILAGNKGDLWDTGKVASDQQISIPYKGKTLVSGQECHWKVMLWEGKTSGSWSTPSYWEMGLLKPSDWKGQWLDDGKPTPTADQDFYQDDPAPLFRKAFVIPKPLAKARLIIAGLGYYEASLNGKKVGDHELDPGWTRYETRVEYSVFDVTQSLNVGENCLGVRLGNGWYYPLPLKLFGSFNLREQLAVGRPRVIAQLQLEFRDGTSQTIATDQSWKVGESGILRNNVYLGEAVDARREPDGWDKPKFDDSHWSTPGLATRALGMITAPSQPPIRRTESWPATQMTEPVPGKLIYDMGTNFAGWASFDLDVPAGTSITFRFGELLKPDGTLNPMTSVAGQIKGLKQGTQESIGGPGAPEIAWQSDTYIARGGRESYTPRFTFHAFRYVEITGLPNPLPLASVRAIRLNSDVEPAGTFECSNPMLNDIQAMCRRTFLSNIFSVQSDCPHRERLGYGGDIVATSEAFMANFNMAGFYAKAVRDWADSARPDGMFTDTAPFIGIQYCGPVWAMAHPLLVHQLYQYYGDSAIGEEQYSSAKRWLELVENKYPDGIITDGLSDHESLLPTPSDALVTPMVYHSANILKQVASRLGKSSDAAHFEKLALKIREAYNAIFYDSKTGKVGPGSQTSQSMALYTGIVPDSERARVLDFLIKDIRNHNNHLTTGILGTKFLLEVLSNAGHADLAYSIATQADFPSWGWMLKNNATTLWEHWEYSDNTYSHNHPMFGSVSQWMMQWLGGIQPAKTANGFDQIVIRPQTPTGLDWVKSSYKGVRGTIVSNWKRTGQTLTFDLTIPGNANAQVVLPALSGEAVSEGSHRLKDTPGVSKVQVTTQGVQFYAGSGTYSFVVRAD